MINFSLLSFRNVKTILSAVLLSLFLGFLSAVALAQKKPNVLVIISDDHTMQSIGAYGSLSQRSILLQALPAE